MFKIIIKDLKLFGYHGVKPEEKKKGQEFLFNLSMWLNKGTFKSGHEGKYEDDLAGTVNYSEVISLIKETNDLKKYNLLETFCEELAEKIFSRFPMILKLKVTIEKTSPPINADIGSVGVRFTTSRDKFTGGAYESAGESSGFAVEPIVFYLSLGTNLADREENLRTAVDLLGRKKLIKVVKISSIYESEPMYVKDQDNFYNIALKGEIMHGYENYSAFEFLGFLKSIEYKMGRKASPERFGPRIIDLDLLYFDNKEIMSDLLTLPHPRIGERNFVLVPLAEIEPYFIFNGKKIADLIKHISKEEKVLKVKKW